MSITEIEAKAKKEAGIYAAAKKIREILDAAGKECEMDDRDVEQEILDLVTE